MLIDRPPPTFGDVALDLAFTASAIALVWAVVIVCWMFS